MSIRTSISLPVFFLCFVWLPLPRPALASTPLMPDPRVTIVHDAAATEAFVSKPEIVKRLVAHAITNVAGISDQSAAWQTIASPTNVIGIKVYSVPGPLSGTRPSVVAAVLEGLLAAGFPATNIILWDKHLADLHLAGYSQLARRYGVRVAGSADSGYDSDVSYDNPIIGNLVWGDLEFDRNLSERFDANRRTSGLAQAFPEYRAERSSGSVIGRKSHVSRLLTRQIQKIINITPLLNHNLAGVSGNLYGLAMGSVDNTVRFELDPSRLSEAVPEIYALPALSDKVVLNITDALICQYEGGERSLLHYSVMLNELWFSKDPVALDSMALRELDKQRTLFSAPASRDHAEGLYSNATLLELGQSDLKLVPVIRLTQ